jgi:hypothetical protein
MAAAYLATSVSLTFPLLASGALGVSDWDAILFHHASVMKSVYSTGSGHSGIRGSAAAILWQNPQVALLTPVCIFALVLPLATAMKLNILLHYLVGFAGMHLLLTRAFKLTFLPAIFFLATTFTLAGGAALSSRGRPRDLPAVFLPAVDPPGASCQRSEPARRATPLAQGRCSPCRSTPAAFMSRSWRPSAWDASR